MKLSITLLLLITTFFSVHGKEIECPKPVIIGEPMKSNYQVIYPIGWSKSGNFAYIHQDIDCLSAGGGYTYNFNVVNMKSDKILCKDQIYFDETDTSFKWDRYSTPIDSIACKQGAYLDYAFFTKFCWPQNRGNISETAKKYGIKFNHEELKDVSSLIKKGITISEERKYNTYKKDDKIFDDKSLTLDYSINVSSHGKVVKSVFTWKIDETVKKRAIAHASYLAFVVKGYFKSPYEERIAIVVFKQTNGYEETAEEPFFVGADLSKMGNRSHLQDEKE